MENNNVILLASNNQGKALEMQEIFAPSGFRILSQKEAGFPLDVEETGSTFAENALLKAQALYAASGLPVLADDSGLIVDALDGRPGVYSARYAGENATDEDRRKKLLAELAEKNVPPNARAARFHCAVAYLEKDGTPHLFEGFCPGAIGFDQRGENGFGYDSIFYYPDLKGRTFAELSGEEKNAVSHRGRALELLKAFLTRRPPV